MNRYTIYCTEAQTKKALELGAPIEYRTVITRFGKIIVNLVTAEQMTGWLEEQNIAIDLRTYFKVNNSRINHYEYTVTDSIRVFNGSEITRQEATLVAIDRALEYLMNNKK